MHPEVVGTRLNNAAGTRQKPQMIGDRGGSRRGHRMSSSESRIESRPVILSQQSNCEFSRRLEPET